MARRRQTANPARVKAQTAALEGRLAAGAGRGAFLGRRTGLVLLNLLAIVLLSASFAPFDCWFLAYVALVPWALALGTAGRGRFAILLAWGAGLVYWLANIYWLWWITLPGYFLAALYLSFYWLAAALILRPALRRGWPAWCVLPVVWTALEYLRNYVISGFPWFFLAHSQYSLAPLIQIADLTGQYGVSFLVAMVNGAAVDLLCGAIVPREGGARRSLRRGLVGAAASAAAMLGVLGYGAWRLGQSTTSPGPVIGVVQQAFPIALTRRAATWQKILDSHLEAASDLAASRCDLVLIPESMLPPGLNVDFLSMDVARLDAGRLEALARRVFSPQDRQEYSDDLYLIRDVYIQRLRGEAQRVGDLSRRLGCPVLAGGVAIRPNPAPIDARDNWLRYNAALWFDAAAAPPPPASAPALADPQWPLGKSAPGFYSKRHLVPFSEYVPFKKSWTWLHRLLRSFVPDVMEQLEPGDLPLTYELVRPSTPASTPAPTRPSTRTSATGAVTSVARAHGTTAPGETRTWRLATPICYEGVFDNTCRDLVWRDGRKDVDILANLSNDGWFVWQLGGGAFHRSTEYSQHLAQYCFRAVENRVPVVRAVNTGISASIDSCGRIRARLQRGGHEIMVAGTMVLDGGGGLDPLGVQHGPLVLVDSRWSVYSRVGDVFAMLVSAAALALTGLLVWRRRGAAGSRTGTTE